ncbi:unnamed protein product, partial [Mesorhabditis spiculigera]
MDASALIFLLLFLIDDVSATKCYQCVTDTMLHNWSRYGMPMRGVIEEVGSKHCVHEENVTQVVECKGLCLTVNVSGEIRGKFHPHMGTLRDCHKFWQQPEELAEGEFRNCHSRVKELNRRTTVNITYCYCQGDYCNGMHRLTSPMSSGNSRPGLKRRSSASVNSILQGLGIFAVVAIGGVIF